MLARALSKVGLLEEELKEAKIAVQHLGGDVQVETATNAVLSDTTVSKNRVFLVLSNSCPKFQNAMLL